MRRSAILVAVILVVGPGIRSVWAQDDGHETSDAEARAVLRGFEKAYRVKDAEARVEALAVMRAHDHPKVAARLVRLLKKKNDPAVQTALLAALAAQKGSGKKVMKKVAAWLVKEAEEAQNRIERVAPGFRVNPRTGDPDLTSDDGRLMLEATKARGLVLREAMLCVRLLSPEPPKDAEDLAVFLQDPHDALVVETLEAFGRWRLTGALPALLELYRMYPTEGSWDTSHVTSTAASPRKARSLWLVRFGHPAKQRRRPDVVNALRACLEAITGRTFETPEALGQWLKTPEGRRAAA